MENSPYVQEILSQPGVLLNALRRVDLSTIAPLANGIRNGDFDRIVITGLGASLYAGYPAWLLLAERGLPAFWVDGAELLHFAGSLVTPRTLLWIISQSGSSAEIIPLLDSGYRHKPARLFATTNDPASPLAQAADVLLPIDAPVENTVATRTYLNALALTQLAALALCGNPNAAATGELEEAGQALSAYLAGWEDHVAGLSDSIRGPKHLVLLGRGPSMAAVLMGSLMLGEAAKMPTIGLNAGEFRHGPLEMAGPGLTVLVFAGAENTAGLNRRLVRDLIHYQASAFIISPQPEDDLPWLAMPRVQGIGQPLAEILPIQLLSIALAKQAGLEPGKFFHLTKVVRSE